MYICLSPYILTIKINYYYNIFVSLTNRERMRKNINIVSIYYLRERGTKANNTHPHACANVSEGQNHPLLFQAQPQP
jgi:hypothetical protein